MNSAQARFPFGLLVILSALLALGAVNPQWLFPTVGWLDEWYYVAYASHYGDPTFLDTYYKISRLPWVLYQYSIRRLLDPETAQYVIQYGCYFLGMTAVYLGLRRLLGDMPAFVGAAFLAVLPAFHGSGGAAYHNTIAGPLYAASFWALTVAAQRDPAEGGRWMGWFGVLYALTVHSSILFVNLSPVLAAHYLITRKVATGSVGPVFKPAVLAAGTALLTTLVLCLINAAVGRKPLFFRLGFDLARSFVRDPSKQLAWWSPLDYSWIMHRVDLGVLAGVAIAAVACCGWCLLRRDRVAANVHAISLCCQFVFLILLWTMWQMIGQTALQPIYFSYPLLVPMAMALASVFAIFGYSRASAGSRIALYATWIASGPMLLILGQHLVAPLRALAPTPFMSALVGVLLTCTVVILAGRWLAGTLGAVALLGVVNAASIYPAPAYVPTRCTATPDAYVVIVEGNLWLKKFAGNTQLAHVWFDEKATIPLPAPCAGSVKMKDFGVSFVATGFRYLEVAVGTRGEYGIPPIAALDSEALRASLNGRETVALVTNDARHTEAMIEKLRDAGITARVGQTRTFSHGVVSVDIVALTVSVEPRPTGR